MKKSSIRLRRSSRLILAVSVLSLGTLLAAQAFGLGSVASASNRDEFPGRRQGGGTHWVLPADAEAVL